MVMRRNFAAAILACSLVQMTTPAALRAAESGRSQRAELGVGIRINAADDQETAWKAHEASLRQALAASGTPRNVALAALENSVSVNASRTLQVEPLLRAAMGARDDALVQWLIANRLIGSDNDARVDALVADAAHLEPDNAAVWGLALVLASKRSEASAIDDALAHMAASTRSDEHFADTVRAWYEIYEHNPFPQSMFAKPSDADNATFVAAIARAAATALAGNQRLVQVCKESVGANPSTSRAADCAAIGHLMLYHSTTMLGRRMGFALLRNLGGDVVTSEDKALQRNLEWVLVEYSAGEDSVDKDPIAMHAYATDWLNFDDEYEIMQRALRRRGLSTDAPSDWQPSEHVSIAQASSR